MKAPLNRFAMVFAFALLPAVLLGQDFTLYDLHIFDVKRNSLTRVTSIPNAGEFNPSWSPDGKRIAHDVVTFDTHALFITDVMTRTSSPLPGGDGGNDAAWSPDGGRIAFDRSVYGDPSVYTLPPTGGVATLVRLDAVDPSWSPSGDYLVFRQLSDGSIRTAPVAGGPDNFLTFGENPVWSPNGTWIAYSQAGDIWVIPVDGSGAPTGSAVQLTATPEWDGQPSWSNNSKDIVFHSNRNGDFDLWTIAVSGGSPERMTGLVGAGDYDPSFSKNGQKIAFAAVGDGVLAGHSHGTITAHSIQVQALKGPSVTDIYVTVSSADPINYPIPSELKKLQVKILNAEGAVVYNQNLTDVPLADNQTVVSIEALSVYQPVRVAAHVQTAETVDEEVLRAIGTGKLRPDLVVQTVNAPGEAGANMAFNVEAVVKEQNLQVGATATVSLFDGEQLLGAIPGVYVPAGEMVSAVFEGIRLSETGPHTLTVRITDAVPGEYDVSNNDYTFVVNVVQATVQPMSYYMSYWNYQYSEHSIFNSCWYSSQYVYENQYRSLYYSGWVSTPQQMNPPLNNLSWKIETEDGVWHQGSITDIPASYSDPWYDVYYVLLDPWSLLYAYVYVYKDPYYGFTQLEIHHYASRYVYRYTVNGVVYYDVTSEYGRLDLNADSRLAISTLVSDDGFSGGGGASLNLGPPVEFSYSDGYSGYDAYYECNYWASWGYTYREASAYQSGMTDPTILPGLGKKDHASTLAGNFVPNITELEQNYPNPFNPSTSIRFTVDQSGPTVLSVYDILGRKVAELFRGMAEPGRSYEAAFDARNLPSGMYYSRLELADGRQLIRKMILAK